MEGARGVESVSSRRGVSPGGEKWISEKIKSRTHLQREVGSVRKVGSVRSGKAIVYPLPNALFFSWSCCFKILFCSPALTFVELYLRKRNWLNHRKGAFLTGKACVRINFLFGSGFGELMCRWEEVGMEEGGLPCLFGVPGFTCFALL
jgi:hypothetical protein